MMQKDQQVICILNGSHVRYFEGVETIDRVSEDGTGFAINAWWYKEDELLPYVAAPHVTRETAIKAYQKQIVAGVGKDAPTVINEQGGKQSHTLYDFTCLDPKAMFEMTKVLKEGREKYGKDNWRSIPVDDHLNHMLIHAFAYLAGDKSDEHLSHIMCRAMFAQACALEVT